VAGGQNQQIGGQQAAVGEARAVLFEACQLVKLSSGRSRR
ncbi:MAG: hypothetical protein ACI8W7_004940, partial [Gammaproteobacteria bacterium]